MNEKLMSNRYVLYLAVLPKYRTACIQILYRSLENNIQIFVSPAHLDESVRTGIPSNLYRSVGIKRILRRKAFVQLGSWRSAIAAETTVLDLNPRSITAWSILAIRAALRRRTLVWGHIHPQAGPNAKTAGLRRAMRTISSGTISYTYRDAQRAESDLPGKPVWVAPNSLYTSDLIGPGPINENDVRTDVLYVGRFAASKKVDLLVRGFASASQILPDIRLQLVGGGDEFERLSKLVDELGISEKVVFAGWIDDPAVLAKYYAKSFCSASPGFAGLGLTQSLGFGVPMIIAEDEPHSPEIELDASGGVHYFGSDSPDLLAQSIHERWNDRLALPDLGISEYTKKRYSAEAMAAGLESALKSNITNTQRIGMPRE